MSRADDTRIVQMQFDNKDFERDVKVSEKTLEKFKEQLDFSKCEKSLDDFSKATKALSFESLVDNVQKLADKFTGLGTLTEHVLTQIRRGIDSAAASMGRFVNSLGLEQISAGKTKFEEMNKNVQAIIAATGDSEEYVYKVLERLNQYTDQTSYNFTDMADNIGKFTAVGIPLAEAEKQMEGIANWAARSGAGIQEASRAMYNISQAMGVGKMTKIDWKSIENARMATKEFKNELIQAGLAAGTLVDDKGVVKTAKSLGKQMEVNYQNLAETLSKGWATREVMENTLTRYYYDDLYYTGPKLLKLTDEQIKKNNELLKDDKLDAAEFLKLEGVEQVTDEVKQKIIDIAVEQKNLVKETDKSGKIIYRTADKYGKKVTVSLSNFTESLSAGWLDKNVAGRANIIEGLGEAAYKAAQKCTTLTDIFNAWKDQLSTGWMKAWQKIFGELSESMELFSAICNKVGDSFTDFIQLLVGDGENALGILGHWEALGGRDSLWSLFVGEYDGMYEGAYGFLDVLHDIGEMISRGFWEMLRIINADEINMSADEWYENTDYRTWFIGQEIKESIENIQNFIKNIKEFFTAVPVGETESRAQKIQKFINGIFAIASIVYTAISDIFGFIKQLFGSDYLGPSIDYIINILEALGLTIRDTGQNAAKGGGLKKFFDQLLPTIKPLTDAINRFIGAISDIFVKLFENGRKTGATTKIWDGIIKVINKLADIIVKFSAPILNFLTGLMEILGDLFTDGFNSESLKKAGNKLADLIGNLFGDIFGLVPEFSAKIEKFLSYIFGFAEDDASKQADGSGKTLLGVIKTWLRKIFGGTADFVGEFKNEMGNVSLFSIIKENLGIGLLGKFIGGLSAIVKGTNLYAIIMSFLGGYSLIKLIKVLKKGGGIFDAIGGFFNGLKGKSIKDLIFGNTGVKTQTLGEKLWTIAKSIGLIVAAIVILGKLPINQLIQGGIAFGVIIAAIAALVFVMDKVKLEGKKLVGMVATIFGIGAAILGITIGLTLLILAIKSLANMKMEQIASMLTGFAGILLILGVFMASVNSMKIKGTASLALLAISIGILVKSLRPLATIDTVGLLKMGASLMAILVMLALFTEEAATMKKSGMGSLVMVAASIWILLESLKPLANYNWEQLGKMGAGLAVLMAVLVQFTKKVSYMKGSGMGSLIMVAVSIWILLEAVKPLANYEWEQLGKMGAGLAVLMFILTQFTKSSESMHSTGMWQLIAVAGALWILVQAIMPLAKFEWGDLAKMGAGLVVLSGIVVLMSRLMKPVGLLQGAGSALMLIGLAAVIAAFAFAMGSIQNTSWTSILAACAGLAAILIVFALIMKQMMLMKAKDLAKALPMFVMLLGLSVVMIAFSFALNEIKKVKTDTIVAFALGLSVLLLAVAAALKIVATIHNPVAMFLGILAIALGMAAIMGVVALMAPLVMGSIGNALVSMSDQLTLLSGLIQTFCGRMEGVDEGSIDKGENIIGRLKDMIYGLLEFVGFKTDISGFTDILFDLGTGLENFSWHMSNTGDLSGNSAIALIKDLAGCANDLDIITNMNIDTLTTKITGLAGAMMLYAQGARDIANENGIEFDENNMPDVTAAVALMKAISESLASGDTTIIPDNMPSEEQLGLFGAQLAALAGALIKFEEAGAGLGEGSEKALSVLDYFKKLKEKLIETEFVSSYNEVTGTFTKEKVDADVLTEFGKNIEQLGSALGTFAHHTTAVNAETGEIEPLNFDSALETLGEFVALKEQMPNVDGVAQFFAGKKESLSTLGAEIEGFGQALHDLSGYVTGTDENGVSNFNPESTAIVSKAADDITELLTTFNEKLPKIGELGGDVVSVESYFTGKAKLISDLGNELAEFGKSLNSLSHSITGKDENGNANFDSSTMDVTKQAVSDMMDIMQVYATKLPRLGRYAVKVSGVTEFINGGHVKTIDELGVELEKFGVSLNGLNNAISGKDAEGNLKFDPSVMPVVKAAVTGMIEIMSMLTDEENGLPKVGGLGKKLSEVFGEGREMNLTDLGNQVGAMSDGLGKLGENLKKGSWNEDNGISNMLSALDYILDMMVSLGDINQSSLSTAQYIGTFSNFVSMLGTAFSDIGEAGLSGSDSVVSLLVKAMADISNAFNEYGDIDANKISMFNTMANALWNLSNVKQDADWEGIGLNITEGVRVGINKGTSGVINSAVDMAIAAYKAAKQALDIESPSRAFETIGDFAARGMALGINKGSGEAANASETMANNVINAARSPLETLSALISGDFDDNPVITPVLDLTNVTNGAQTLNSLFNNPYGIGLAGGSLTLDPTRATIYADTALPRDYSEPIYDIKSQIIDLRNDLQNMSEAIRNMRMVMNTGALVGAIGPEMDQYLGQQGYYSARADIP